MAQSQDIVPRLLDFDRQLTATERFVMRMDAANLITFLRAENAKLAIPPGSAHEAGAPAPAID